MLQKNKSINTLVVIIAGAFAIHAATALLRLNSFFPITKLTDFASYYISAWLLHHGHSPYPLPVKVAEAFSKAWGLPHALTSTPSTPLWLIFIEPFAFLSFPLAAGAWFLFNLGILAYCHKSLARMAGYINSKMLLLTIPVTITFGPLFLNLTIGQCGLVLLAGSLLLIQEMGEGESTCINKAGIILFIASVSAKIYPISWIYGSLMGRSFRKLGILSASILVSFLGFAIFDHKMLFNYLFTFMPSQADLYSEKMNLIDDQSVYGYLRRLMSHGSAIFPGRVVSHVHQLHWHWPWELSNATIMILSVCIIAFIYLIITFKIYKIGQFHKEPVFIIGVLLSIIVLPHMARYNGIMALPAMAWLWGTGSLYLRYLSAISYFLFALSRLTHLWALILPGKLAIIMSGAGLIAVLLLIYAMLSGIATKSVRQEIQTDP